VSGRGGCPLEVWLKVNRINANTKQLSALGRRAKVIQRTCAKAHRASGDQRLAESMARVPLRIGHGLVAISAHPR
jgi:hypothetical protein